MTTLLNISAIARRTGIAPDTLRKWERRYGVLRPARTTGGQRRYSEDDVARVEWLRDRLSEGWRISVAAEALTEAVAGGANPAPVTGAHTMRRELRRMIASGDLPAVAALLDRVFAAPRLGVVCESVLAPLLQWVGKEWQQGRMSVALEHAVTGLVRARLEQRMIGERPPLRGTAVLACAPGEQHDVGLLMLAVLLRADGWAVAYLGAATPVDHAVRFAETAGARLLCVSASQAGTYGAFCAELETVPGRGVVIALGGAATVGAQPPTSAVLVPGGATAGVRQLRVLAGAGRRAVHGRARADHVWQAGHQ